MTLDQHLAPEQQPHVIFKRDLLDWPKENFNQILIATMNYASANTHSDEDCTNENENEKLRHSVRRTKVEPLLS